MVLTYVRTPLLPLSTGAQRSRFIVVIAVSIMIAVLLVHAFSPPGLSPLELAVHAATVWAGFFCGMLLAAWVVLRLPMIDPSRPTVGLLWMISASGFALGMVLVGALDSIVFLAPVAAKATSLHGSMMLGLIPMWALVTTFLVRTEILRAYESRLTALEAPRPPAPARSDHTIVQLGGDKSAISLPVGDILAVSGAENYCRVAVRKHGGASSTLIRATLQSVMESLPQSRFIRVHRSHVVNADYVSRTRRSGRQFYVVVEGVEDDIPISRQRYKNVIARLEPATAPIPRE